MDLDSLGKQAAELMMVGAVDYLRAQGLAQTVDLDALVLALRAQAPKAVDAAMADAREAFAIPGMEKIAAATFAVTMRLAGVEAAKAVTR